MGPCWICTGQDHNRQLADTVYRVRVSSEGIRRRTHQQNWVGSLVWHYHWRNSVHRTDADNGSDSYANADLCGPKSSSRTGSRLQVRDVQDRNFHHRAVHRLQRRGP